MVGDYQRGGNNIVNEYERARKHEYGANKAKKSKAKAALLKRFQDAKHELRSRATKFKEEATDFKTYCEKKGRSLNASMETLMALSTE